jgi:hypothetical protein
MRHADRRFNKEEAQVLWVGQEAGASEAQKEMQDLGASGSCL